MLLSVETVQSHQKCVSVGVWCPLHPHIFASMCCWFLGILTRVRYNLGLVCMWWGCCGSVHVEARGQASSVFPSSLSPPPPPFLLYDTGSQWTWNLPSQLDWSVKQASGLLLYTFQHWDFRPELSFLVWVLDIQTSSWVLCSGCSTCGAFSPDLCGIFICLFQDVLKNKQKQK